MKATGEGKVLVKVDVLRVVRAWLFNFDIDGAIVKENHKKVLDELVGPVLRDGGAVKLLGLASTTSTVQHDHDLGLARAAAVHLHLLRKFGNRMTVLKEVSFGKEMALAFESAGLKGGTRDQTESELWRAVVINAWNRSLPPPPPSPVDVPFENKSWLTTAGQAVDLTSGVLGIVDLAVDIAGLAAASVVTGVLGLALSSLSAIVAMPLIFINTDMLANTNGQIQGGADAIQDMADQFSDAKLAGVPMKLWPRIVVPATHLPSNPQPTVSQNAWRLGQVTGRDNAVKLVIDMEQNPRPVTTPSGEHIRMNGRLWLRAVSHQFGDNAGVEAIVKPANAQLAKQGRPPFPTR